MGLPSVYSFRVTSLIQKSEISIEDITSIQRSGMDLCFVKIIVLVGLFSVPEISMTDETRPVQRFKKNWEAFAMRCREEWSNLNIVSTLLLR